MVRQYGRDNGFGWRLNDVIGAQIISVPDSLPATIANRGARQLVFYLIVIALVTLGVLDGVLYLTVIRPVSRLSTMADEISRGNMEVEELPVRGKDEISVLAASFNRMHRSLGRAMEMLSRENPIDPIP
jgi:protein-histidine pros-kinase